MDPVTHAASGVVAMLAMPSRPATFWSLPLAALACASPDIDLAFIRTPLEFLQLHRGITHSFAAAPIFGLLLALLCYPLWRASTPGHWHFGKVWLFCIGMILLHIWLDVVTTYGTMVFLPFSHYRVRLNSIFIIDLLVTVPLLWAIWRWRARRALILAVLAWIFIYPAAGVAINAWHTDQWQSRLRAENADAANLVTLPDAFAPFFWRVLYERDAPDGKQVLEQSINALGQSRAGAIARPAAPAELVSNISKDSTDGEVYFNFALLPVMENLRFDDRPEQLAENARLLMFYDLRFGSGLQFVRQLMALRPNADMPFQLMAELLEKPGAQSLADADIGRIRLRFSDSGRDSSWHRPMPPRKPDWLQWLAGIN